MKRYITVGEDVTLDDLCQLLRFLLRFGGKSSSRVSCCIYASNTNDRNCGIFDCASGRLDFAELLRVDPELRCTGAIELSDTAMVARLGQDVSIPGGEWDEESIERIHTVSILSDLSMDQSRYKSAKDALTQMVGDRGFPVMSDATIVPAAVDEKEHRFLTQRFPTHEDARTAFRRIAAMFPLRCECKATLTDRRWWPLLHIHRGCDLSILQVGSEGWPYTKNAYSLTWPVLNSSTDEVRHILEMVASDPDTKVIVVRRSHMRWPASNGKFSDMTLGNQFTVRFERVSGSTVLKCCIWVEFEQWSDDGPSSRSLSLFLEGSLFQIGGTLGKRLHWHRLRS